MATSTYQPGTFLFTANTAASKSLTDTDLNTFGGDLLAKITSVVPSATGLLAATGMPGVMQPVTLGSGLALQGNQLMLTTSPGTGVPSVSFDQDGTSGSTTATFDQA